MKDFLIIIAMLIVSCEKEDINYHINNDNLTTIPEWTIIDFKTNYTIQVPLNFFGIGMAGFEGNTFSKYSNDGSILLTYGFCDGLFCYDFGDTLQKPFPLRLSINENSGDEHIILNEIIKYYDQTVLMGIFFYSNNAISYGRLYWNDNDYFKQAMSAKFHYSKLDTVIKIISTIKRK
jgi:hypothetical protein